MAATMPTLLVEDVNGSMCNDWECDDQLWTAEEFLLLEGTHKELLLCHETYGVSCHLHFVHLCMYALLYNCFTVLILSAWLVFSLFVLDIVLVDL